MTDDHLDDLAHMGRALDLARATTGLASPNPMVGCVLVRDGQVLAEGAHRFDARDHAEIVALKAARAAGRPVAGATAYVTLEPCSHHGRTPPCADALIAAQVGRVVAATVDPNPQVSGRGLERIRAAGIPAVAGVRQAEARELNAGFASWICTRRPLVTLKAALSADGMLAPAARARTPGETFWLTGPLARAEVQALRHGADAVLTGIGTVLADDPLLTDRSGGLRRRRLLRVVLDSNLRTPVGSRLVRTISPAGGRDVLILCGPGAPEARAAALTAAGAEVLRMPAWPAGFGRGADLAEGAAAVAPRGRIDLGAVLDLLGSRQVLNVLLECGAQLNGAFLQAGLVDRVVLFQTTAELGPESVPFASGYGPVSALEPSLGGVQRAQLGPDVRLSGILRDPWPAATSRL